LKTPSDIFWQHIAQCSTLHEVALPHEETTMDINSACTGKTEPREANSCPRAATRHTTRAPKAPKTYKKPKFQRTA
jgi:hypothetical protein